MANANYPLTRVLPADMYEIIQKWGDITASQVITNMQALITGLTNACPQCQDPANADASSGWVNTPVGNNQTVRTICPLCKGELMTAGNYVSECIGSKFVLQEG